MKKHFKEYEELCFTDDYMFCMILTTRLDLCKELLELILDIKIRKVEIAEQQKNVDITYDGKGVRFDVYVDDAENTVYDIEMQTTRQKDLPKRTRYYQGMIDLNLIQKGMRYSELKKSYVIFICLEDVFGKNLPVYTFNYICEQDYSVRLGDERDHLPTAQDGAADNGEDTEGGRAADEEVPGDGGRVGLPVPDTAGSEGGGQGALPELSAGAEGVQQGIGEAGGGVAAGDEDQFVHRPAYVGDVSLLSGHAGGDHQ